MSEPMTLLQLRRSRAAALARGDHAEVERLSNEIEDLEHALEDR